MVFIISHIAMDNERFLFLYAYSSATRVSKNELLFIRTLSYSSAKRVSDNDYYFSNS